MSSSHQMSKEGMVAHSIHAYVDYAGTEALMETIAIPILKFGRSSLCMVVLQQMVNKCCALQMIRVGHASHSVNIGKYISIDNVQM